MQTFTEGSQDLGAGVTREYLHDAHLVIYTPHGSGRNVTDTWVNNVMADMHTWNPYRPYLCVLDLSHTGTSDYMKTRLVELYRSIPEHLAVYYGVVVSHVAVHRFMTVMLENLSEQPVQRQMDYALFQMREEAINWLENFLDD